MSVLALVSKADGSDWRLVPVSSSDAAPLGWAMPPPTVLDAWISPGRPIAAVDGRRHADEHGRSAGEPLPGLGDKDPGATLVVAVGTVSGAVAVAAAVLNETRDPSPSEVALEAPGARPVAGVGILRGDSEGALLLQAVSRRCGPDMAHRPACYEIGVRDAGGTLAVRLKEVTGSRAVGPLDKAGESAAAKVTSTSGGRVLSSLSIPGWLRAMPQKGRSHV